MQLLDVGEPINIRTTWWDDNGAPTDPQAISLIVTTPDGQVFTNTMLDMVREALGVWVYTTPASMTGVWLVHAVGTLLGDEVIQDSAVLVGGGEQTGPCDNWCSWDDVVACGAPIVEPSLEQRELWIEQATEILFDLSDRHYPGICTVTRSLCFTGMGCWPSGSGWSYGPYASAGACDPWPAVDLGGRYPVLGAWDVVVDAVTLDPSAYRVRNHRWLVRLDGEGWPGGWNTADPAAFSVTWATGRVPTPGGKSAAAVLTAEIAKRCVGDASCRLPSRVTNVVREGVTFTVLDSLSMIEQGRTGLELVDLWLVADKNGRKPRPGIFHPAAHGQRRYA